MVSDKFFNKTQESEYVLNFNASVFSEALQTPLKVQVQVQVQVLTFRVLMVICYATIRKLTPVGSTSSGTRLRTERLLVTCFATMCKLTLSNSGATCRT